MILNLSYSSALCEGPTVRSATRTAPFSCSGDGRYLALMTEDGSVNVYDTSESPPLISTFSLPVQEQDPGLEANYGVYFAPTSRSGIFVTTGHRAGLWNMDTGTVEELPREMGFGPVASFSPDCRFVSSFSADNAKVLIWDKVLHKTLIHNTERGMSKANSLIGKREISCRS